ncbi:MAG: gliding motility-associated C-terminal domain-containing protein [Crocinitomicaceae bacterium]
MKKMRPAFFNTVVVLIAFTFTNFAFSADFYWINGAGSWSNPTHWSSTSGGASVNQIPGPNDNVIFDNNSFNNDYTNVLFDVDAEINNLTISSSQGVNIFGGQNNLILHGNFEATNNFNLNIGALHLNNLSNITNILNTNDVILATDVHFNSGKWILDSKFQTTWQNSIYLNDGELNTNAFSVSADQIVASNNNFDLNASNSVLYAVSNLNLSKAINIGQNADFWTNTQEVNTIEKGDFSGSNFTKDQTTLCDNLTLTVEILTLDYPGGKQVSCNDSCDGELTINVSGSAGPYLYNFDNQGFTGVNFYDNLCADNYLITVQDLSNEIGPPGSGIFYQCSVQELLQPPTKLQLNLLGTVVPTCPTSCDGTIVSNAVGGTSPYNVSWSPSGINGTTSPSGLCAGDHTATVIDLNNCTLDTTFTLTGPPQITADVTITEPTCNGDCDGEIDVTPANGNGGPYTYSWSTPPTSGQGTMPGIGFCAGPVTLSIFDVDGCQFDTIITMTEPAVLGANPTADADASCFGSCDGQASANPFGGAGGNQFEWFTCLGVSTGITDENPTTLCAGDYYVEVTDQGGAGCVIQSACITIDEPVEIDATADAYQVSCFGVCDGSVDVDAVGGTLPYTYSWVTVPGGSGVGANDTLFGLCPGLYEVTVTDANLCNSTPDTVEIIEPLPVTVVINSTDPTCYDLCDGTATATPAGGTLPYSFLWTPAPGAGQGTANATAMCAGSYDLLVTDDNGCNITETVVINAPPQYDITTAQTDLQCAGDANGTIDVTVNSGGSGVGYTYTWAPAAPVGDGTPNVSGLTAGVWCVTITDDMLCDTTLCFTITEPTPLTATASVISQVSCFGDCNGSAQVVITGGTNPVDILWSDPGNQTTNVASGLCAGAYTVDLTDANGCTASDNINIVEPAQYDMIFSQTDIVCFGSCDGSATVTVNSGGTPAYTYQWDDPLLQTTPTALNLCAGVYTVTVSDQNLCDSVITYTIAEPTEIVIDTNVINSSCFNSCSGAAYITAVGGTGAYTFEWFDAITGLPLGVNNDSITNLCPGSYYAQITDAALCQVNSDTMTITELPEIFTNVVTEVDATCGVCDGTAEVLATGGTGTFTYTWTPAPGAGQGTASVTGLCAGAYNVVATDNTGCPENIAVTINSVALEVTSMDSTDISCFGLCDGTATITYNVIDAPYTVEWFDNLTGLPIGIIDNPASQPSTATGLCAGEYLAVLTNNTGCVTSDTIVVNEPPEITGSVTPTPVTCNGDCDGSATVVAAGGTGTLTYNWGVPIPGSGQGTTTASGLCAGNWQVTVTDDQGCNEVFTTTISEPTLMVIDSESSTDISCFGANDGTATVIHSGGLPPYTYEWFDCNTGLAIGQTTQMATNLGPGDYQVVVTDNNLCTITSACLPVVEPTGISAIINVSPVNCFGFCDGLIDVVPSGGSAPYFYQWQDEFFVDIAGQTNDTLNNVCQGVYNVEVTDINGCSQTFGPVDMTSPTDPWNVTEAQTDITCSGNCDGTASVTVISGNNPPYTYLWDDPLTQTTPTATNLCAGTYTVTITDASICDTTITFTIVDANPIFANASITNAQCFGDCNGSVDVAPTGGTGIYTVNWSDLQTGTTASNLCAGAITATITDGAGCTMDTTINITEPTELTANSTFSNNATCGVCNGSATINMAGGSPPYIYDWTPDPGAGDGTNNATGLCPGVISVLVTDQNGCTLTEVFGISDINAETLTMSTTDASCFGVCDGTADAAYVCGDPACTNQWFDGGTGTAIAGETNTSIAGLCAGDYYIEVTNASGCVAVELVTINSPTQIIANEVITEITCNGASDASITLTPSGGSGAGYTYVWSPVPTNGQGTNQALNIGAGTWCVDITDGSGCTENVCFDLTEPTPIVITPTVTDPSCNGDCNGIISLSVSGGYGTYTYAWLDGGGTPIAGETGSVIGNLCAGNYTAEVTDAGGCVQTLLITLTEPTTISAPITSTNALCFGDCSGTAEVTPAGGFPPYTVNWFDSGTNLLIGQTGTLASNLCPGDYHAVVTDANGCSFTSATVTITEPAELTFVLNSNDASCFGICDGDADIVGAGGTVPYSYEWLDISGNPLVGGTNPNVVNLCEGNYTVELTDDNGCTTGQQAVVINGFPEITGNIFSNDATCGLSDGNATVNANGGNPPFVYQWYDDLLNPLAGETNNILLNAAAGTYFVDVTDANGCTQQFQANISNLPSTTLTWDAVNHPACFGSSDGSLEITTTAVSPPLTYQWNPGGIIAEDPTGLTAGTWTLQITDALGCINFYDTTLVDPAEIIVTNNVTPTDCGQCNGAIDLTVTGGTGTINILWNNSATGASITGLCSSVYEAQITDQNGCLVVETVDVPNNAGLVEDVVIQAISCAGSCDGQATVTGVGGTAPYTYLWLHDNSTSQTQTGLCAGTYFCEITDDAGCTRTAQVEMLDPNAITDMPQITNPACGLNDGSITVTTSGGVLPHSYLWNTLDVTNIISNVGAGTYTLTVTDAAGCTQDFVYGLSNSNAAVAIVAGTDVNCHGVCDGTADTVSVTGGTSPYTFDWLDNTGTSTGILTPAATNLCAGDYMLETTDALGCISYVDLTITEPDTIILNPLVLNDPTCSGLCDGEIISNPIGGTLPFVFAWDDPMTQSTVNAIDLCDGTYTISITDANGCFTSQVGTLVEPTAISIITDSIIDATCLDSPDGEIYITIAGGTPTYTTQWVSQTLTDTLTDEDPTGLLPMDYYLTVTDINGCIYEDTLSVDTLLVVLADAGLDTLLCSGFGVTLNATSNINPGADYTWYDITMTTNLSDTSELILPSNSAGVTSYIVEVVYSGCTHTDTIDVTTSTPFTADAGPDIEMFANQSEMIGGNPTSADLTHTYDWTPITYLSDPSASNPTVVEPQSSDWYYVTATDTNGCTAIDSMYVTLRPDIIIPDGISPDGNSLNDTWILDFIELYPGVSISINVYNRWGEPLFTADETYQDDWAGTTKDGKKLPAGTYYYTIVIDHEDFPDPFTGPITIMW